jgi:hypothetical protein
MGPGKNTKKHCWEHLRQPIIVLGGHCFFKILGKGVKLCLYLKEVPYKTLLNSAKNFLLPAKPKILKH